MSKNAIEWALAIIIMGGAMIGLRLLFGPAASYSFAGGCILYSLIAAWEAGANKGDSDAK